MDCWDCYNKPIAHVLVGSARRLIATMKAEMTGYMAVLVNI